MLSKQKLFYLFSQADQFNNNNYSGDEKGEEVDDDEAKGEICEANGEDGDT